MNDDNPTELTEKDIDKCCEMLMNSEIKPNICLKCSKKYYLGSYGNHIGECDECWFSRFPKDEVKDFCRSFLE